MQRYICILVAGVLFSASPTRVSGDDLSDAISALRAVGAGNEGATEARAAAAVIRNTGASAMIPVLQGFKGCSPLAGNWLRSSFESLAGAELSTGRELPASELLGFIRDTSGSPDARRLAYEWLLRQSPELEADLIPDLLLDPCPEFRRDAVAQLISKAGESDGAESIAAYRKALRGAVHEDQVSTISKALREAGEEVDIQKHFGFLPGWRVIGPFNNKDGVGYAAVYPPETEGIDPSAEYEGQLGKVSWSELTTDDDYGVFSIADLVENYKGSVMYASTTYRSAAARDLEFRLGTPNAWKLWVNGELVFEREEYHRSTQMDQYRIPVTLKAGDNTILLKVCQNEQEESWAQRYQFQLRVCDSTGVGVLAGGQSAAVDAPIRR